MKCNVEFIINIRILNAVKKQSLKSHLLIFVAKISIHFSCLRRDHSGGGHVHRVGRFVPGQHHLQPAHPHQGRRRRWGHLRSRYVFTVRSS